MPDPNFNPHAVVMSIEAIQEACEKVGARLVFLPQGENADDMPAQFALNNGRELKLPLAELRTDKSREASIAELVERLKKGK